MAFPSHPPWCDHSNRVILDEVYKLWRSLLCGLFIPSYVWVCSPTASLTVLSLRRKIKFYGHVKVKFQFYGFLCVGLGVIYEINLNFPSKHFFIPINICPDASRNTFGLSLTIIWTHQQMLAEVLSIQVACKSKVVFFFQGFILT
jgi:hypothetical protein